LNGSLDKFRRSSGGNSIVKKREKKKNQTSTRVELNKIGRKKKE
jgi:hypothetical protein